MLERYNSKDQRRQQLVIPLVAHLLQSVRCVEPRTALLLLLLKMFGIERFFPRIGATERIRRRTRVVSLAFLGGIVSNLPKNALGTLL